MNDIVFTFSQNVLKRYEPCIDNGTYFLYDTSRNFLWTGNHTSKILLDLVDGKKNLDTIKNEFTNVLNTNDINAINDSVDVIFYELKNIGLIKEV